MGPILNVEQSVHLFSERSERFLKDHLNPPGKFIGNIFSGKICLYLQRRPRTVRYQAYYASYLWLPLLPIEIGFF
jgi:hypothetical protein